MSIPSGTAPNTHGARLASVVVHVVFITSGMAALIYQMAWQRSLLVLFGSNTESVAIVVAAFLVGLGLGSLVGGYVSSLKNAPLVAMFAGTEVIIGLYGLASLHLFQLVAEFSGAAGMGITGMLAFALLLLPTLLMGATLPLLLQYRVMACGHVGRSVSWLYFVNTLGAALGSFAASVVLLKVFGLSGTVLVAAGLNLFSAITVFAVCFLQKR